MRIRFCDRLFRKLRPINFCLRSIEKNFDETGNNVNYVFLNSYFEIPFKMFQATVSSCLKHRFSDVVLSVHEMSNS